MPNISIVPNRSRVSRAYDFYNNTLWIGLGKTTPWTDEGNPPAPDPGVETIDEPVIYKKATVVSFVVEDELGELAVYRNNELIHFSFISPTEAIDQNISSIFIEGQFLPAEVGDEVVYRQVGIFSHLTPAEGYESADILTPANITDIGFLEWISHQEPVYIQPNQINTIQVIITF